MCVQSVESGVIESGFWALGSGKFWARKSRSGAPASATTATREGRAEDATKTVKIARREPECRIRVRSAGGSAKKAEMRGLGQDLGGLARTYRVPVDFSRLLPRTDAKTHPHKVRGRRGSLPSRGQSARSLRRRRNGSRQAGSMCRVQWQAGWQMRPRALALCAAQECAGGGLGTQDDERRRHGSHAKKDLHASGKSTPLPTCQKGGIQHGIQHVTGAGRRYCCVRGRERCVLECV